MQAVKRTTKFFFYYDLNLQKLYLQSQLLIPQHSMGIQQTPGKCHVIYTSSKLTQSLKVKKNPHHNDGESMTASFLLAVDPSVADH